MKNRLLVTSYSLLVKKKNLLAFSHGLDSTALFQLLLENGIPFDIALVNYGLRAQADEEEVAARELAQRHGLRAHIVRAPKWKANFEAEARRFRYAFFEALIDEHGYENLLTAHQLGDRLEWMLMRLIRGAGAVELAGMEPVSQRITKKGITYRLMRPLLGTSRAELREWLEDRGLRWFEDTGNEDPSIERNRIREEFAAPLMERYREGIGRSFGYLEEDRQRLLEDFELVHAEKELRVLRVKHPNAWGRAADRTLKELGYLLTAKEREVVGEKNSVVVGRRWAVERSGDLLFIVPYLEGITLPKAFRERCRRAGIPPKVRRYLYAEGIGCEELVTSN